VAWFLWRRMTNRRGAVAGPGTPGNVE
jgi:hypothetical protein